MAKKLDLQLIYFRLQIRAHLRSPLLFLARQLSRILETGIVIAYNSAEIYDGAGAQAQRILSIRALAAYLEFGYLHSEVRQISVHPLDSHQNEEGYAAFLERFNRQFEFSSDLSDIDAQNYPQVYVSKLDFLALFSFILRFRNKKRCIIKISECYDVTDSRPQIYSLATSLLLNRFTLSAPKIDGQPKVIAIHYRSIPRSYGIYSGEKRTRQLQPERVLNLLNRIMESQVNSRFQIKIYTDAPRHAMKLPVFAKQEHLWHNTPGYKNGYLELDGSNIYRVFEQVNSEVEYIIGGDPIEAIVGLVNSDILITSKSSLSFVASLLFTGEKVFIPYEFWHTSDKASRF